MWITPLKKLETYIAQVMLRLYLQEKLHETMDIRIGNDRLQVLDYEGIIFKCRRFHKYTNLAKNCCLHFKKISLFEEASKKKRTTGEAFDVNVVLNSKA